MGVKFSILVAEKMCQEEVLLSDTDGPIAFTYVYIRNDRI